MPITRTNTRASQAATQESSKSTSTFTASGNKRPVTVSAQVTFKGQSTRGSAFFAATVRLLKQDSQETVEAEKIKSIVTAKYAEAEPSCSHTES